MLECPVCHGEVPEVLGAPEQRCPHCRSIIARAPVAGVPGPVSEQPVDTEGTGPDAVGALKAGVRTWLQNFLAFWAFWLVPSLVTAGTTLLGYALGLHEAFAEGSLRAYAIMLPLGWIDLTVTLVYVAGVAGMVQEARTRGYASLSGGYATLSAQGERLLQVATIVTALLFLATALLLAPLLAFTYLDLSPVTTFLLLVFLIVADVPAILFIFWYLFVLPVAALHPEWPTKRAFAESRAFARRNRTVGFTFALLLVLVGSAVLSFVAVRLLQAGLRFAGSADTPLAFLEALQALLASLLVSVIPVAIATYYLRAGAPAASPGPGHAPEPLSEEPARPGPRERQVRCPSCRTPIRYLSTGKPVRVTCPTCGRQGTLR